MIVRPSFERRLHERSIMDEWLSYAEAAERLNTTVEVVRLRALRSRWQKTIGNQKRPRIRLPEGWFSSPSVAISGDGNHGAAVDGGGAAIWTWH
jgi:hypothetical protein